MHQFNALLTVLAATLLAVSCRSTRNAATTTTTTTTTTVTPTPQDGDSDAVTAYVARVRANAQTAKTVTARISMSLTAAGKDISAGGTLRMKRDDVVQLSLTILGFEVARMEFSPADVLIIDRYNRRYVRATYADVGFLRQAGLDFTTLQALFWGELFNPGGTGDDAYTIAPAGDHTRLTLPNVNGLAYDFMTQTATARLDEVTAKSTNIARPGQFDWTYGNFATLGGQPFPTSMACRVTGLGKDYGFTLSLSRLGNDTGWEAHTQVSNKYTQLRIDDILGSLLK